MSPARVGLPFARSEYDARHAAVRARMAALDLDLLIVTEPSNIVYLTGYDGASYYVPQMVALAAADGDPVWLGRGQDVTGVTIASILGPDSIEGYADEYIDSYGEHAVAEMARRLQARGLGAGRIGVELDAHYFTARTYLELARAFPDATLVDADRLVNQVRLIKSAAELVYMREAARIAEKAMTVAQETVRPGVRGCDVAAAIYAAQASGTPEYGGDYVAIQPLVIAGERTAAPHLGWTDEPLRSGQSMNIELAGCRFRYHSALARTFFLGTPPARLASLAVAVNDALGEALAVVRPGIEAQAYEAAFRAALAPTGYVKASRIGYPTGIGYPPNWGERSVSFRPGDTTILESGMTFHTIPAMWLDDIGYEVSTTFLVTDTGVEELTRFPHALLTVD
jgi:Xaa-Pro dipeptidase